MMGIRGLDTTSDYVKNRMPLTGGLIVGPHHICKHMKLMEIPFLEVLMINIQLSRGNELQKVVIVK